MTSTTTTTARRLLEQFRMELELFFAATTMNFESEAAR